MTRAIVTGLKKTVMLNQSILASELFEVVPGGVPVATYIFQDFNTSATSGFFTLNGVALPQGQRFEVSAAQLSELRYVGGSAILSERILVFVRDADGLVSNFDGIAQAFTVRSNTTPPVARAHAFSVVGDEFILGTQIVSGFDPDGHPIVSFQIRDLKADQGYFEFKGVVQTQGEFFTVDFDDLSQLRYFAKGPASTEQFEVTSFDGVLHSNVSRATATIIPNLSRPIVRYVSAIVPGLSNGINLADSARVTDAEDNTIKTFRFFNDTVNPNHGEIVFNGVVQPRRTWITVNREDFDKIRFAPKNQEMFQTITYEAFDGTFWSAGINRIDIRTNFVIPPTIPVFKPSNTEFYDSQRVNIALNTMFQKLDAGSPFTAYEVFDPTTAGVTGYFATNGIPLPSGSIRQLTPLQFANTSYVTAAFEDHRRETIYVRAGNGQLWGNWEKVDITTYPEIWNGLNSGSSWFNQPMVNFLPMNSQGRRVMTYSFMQEFPNYPSGEARDGDPLLNEHFTRFTDLQRANVRIAFAHMEDLFNIQFVEIADTSTNVFGQRGGIFRFGEYGIPAPESSAAAYAFFPSMGPSGGDSWYNRLNMETSFVRGTGSFSVLLHELGHAMGLKHSFEGVGRLPEALESSDFTVMSYTAAGAPTTFQLYDIHQLQRQYGANLQYASGNDVYSPSTIDFREHAIWDGGGIDMISAFGTTANARIDLRAGNESVLGPMGSRSRYRIAIGVEIEHAWGGSGNDILIGNHLNNILVGEGGNDFLWGGPGTDTLRGGAGNDVYEFGVADGYNTINELGGGGNDRLQVTPFPGLTLLQDDFVFRRLANDLVVDLTLNRGRSQGVARIVNHFDVGSEIETLRFNGVDVDLINLGSQVAGSSNQRFQLTSNLSPNGFLVTPLV